MLPRLSNDECGPFWCVQVGGIVSQRPAGIRVCGSAEVNTQECSAVTRKPSSENIVTTRRLYWGADFLVSHRKAPNVSLAVNNNFTDFLFHFGIIFWRVWGSIFGWLSAFKIAAFSSAVVYSSHFNPCSVSLSLPLICLSVASQS